jgi:hypothetical protein
MTALRQEHKDVLEYVCKYLFSELPSEAMRECAVSYLRGGKSTLNRGLLHNFYHSGCWLSSGFKMRKER